MTKRILIADDHHVVRVGTFMTLREAFPNVSMDFAVNYDEVKEKVASKQFDLIILDIEMPGSIYRSMIKELKSLHSDIRILIFSSYDESVALQYYKEGVNGFLNKLSESTELITAVETILEKRNYYTAYIIEQMLEKKEASPIDILSARETDIFNLLAKGYGNLEISNRLGLQETTVATHKRRIYIKLKITNLADLIKIYNSIH